MIIALFSRTASGLTLLGACLLMAACTHADTNASLEQSVTSPRSPQSQMMALAPEHEKHAQPIATLPEAAGAIQGVRTHDYVDGLRQDILLRDGAIRTIQDSITILARTDRRVTLDEQVPLYKPTEAAVRSEIGGQFPHIAMQVVERDSHNTYGSYGLALGRTGNDMRCLFMWQWIDANRLPSNAGVMGPVSVRVRLCKAGTTFDAMASFVDRLVIGGAARAEVATADGQIHVIAAPAEAAAVETSRKPTRHAALRKRTRVAKHHRTTNETAMIAPPASSAAGPHYMSQAVSVPSPAQGIAVRQMPTTTPVTTAAISSDLPSQAYLGPKAAKAY